MKNPKKIKKLTSNVNKGNRFEKTYANIFQDRIESKIEKYKIPQKITNIEIAHPTCFTSCYKKCRRTKGRKPCWIDCNMNCLH